VAQFEKLCDTDIPHIGALLQNVRETRGISATAIARTGGPSSSTISRIENGESKPQRNSIERYIKAIQSLAASSLEDRHAQMLLELRHHSRMRRARERSYSGVNFRDITRRSRPEKLSELVAALEAEDGPAMIMDDLYFIHALNGAALLLYDVDPQADFLHRWEAWQTLAAKFLSDYQVREAHPYPDDFLPQILAYFLEDKNAYTHLFTHQMRTLICRLVAVSEEEHFRFLKWWELASAFLLSYRRTLRSRALLHRDQRIYVDVARLHTEVVEVVEGYPVNYTYGAWFPSDTDARDRFNEISESSMSHEIFYAADYDKNEDFHVNSWEEVRPYLNSLFRADG
jgi:transcriptional regulator with XRE-family HTH domain